MSTAHSQDCRVCAIASGHYALGEVDRPWLEEKRYVAFTSLGSLIEGWSLAAPRAHSLNLLDNYADTAFVEFVHKAIGTIEAIYGSVVVFEHGGQHEGSATNCGTSHAHLHIVPLGFSLQHEASRFDPSLKWAECSLKNIKGLVGKREYLFVADRYAGVETTGSVCILDEGQSQFFRRVIASKLGRPEEANYRTHPNLAAAAAGSSALRLLSGHLKAA